MVFIKSEFPNICFGLDAMNNPRKSISGNTLPSPPLADYVGNTYIVQYTVHCEAYIFTVGTDIYFPELLYVTVVKGSFTFLYAWTKEL